MDSLNGIFDLMKKHWAWVVSIVGAIVSVIVNLGKIVDAWGKIKSSESISSIISIYKKLKSWLIFETLIPNWLKYSLYMVILACMVAITYLITLLYNVYVSNSILVGAICVLFLFAFIIYMRNFIIKNGVIGMESNKNALYQRPRLFIMENKALGVSWQWTSDYDGSVMLSSLKPICPNNKCQSKLYYQANFWKRNEPNVRLKCKRCGFKTQECQANMIVWMEKAKREIDRLRKHK